LSQSEENLVKGRQLFRRYQPENAERLPAGKDYE